MPPVTITDENALGSVALDAVTGAYYCSRMAWDALRGPDLVLGGAQLGSTYGVTNSGSCVQTEAVKTMLHAAWSGGIRTVDTAPSYGGGKSESLIGEFAADLQVQTKVRVAGQGPGAIRGAVAQSLHRLRRSSVECLLIHDWAALSHVESRRGAQVLRDLCDEGIARFWGTSIYDPSELDRAALLEANVIQVPGSVLDQRFNGPLAAWHRENSCPRIQVRSVFLQGRIASGRDSHPDVQRLEVATAALRMGSVEFALAYVSQLVWASDVIVGATSLTELANVLALWKRLYDGPVAHEVDWSVLASRDPELIDPRRW